MRPLEGFVVGVTADRRWQEQAELLERRGATIVHGPTMTTAYLASDEDLRRATLSVIDSPPDYLVATTGIGIRAWLETAAAWGLGDRLVDALVGTKIVARGPKAAGAIQAGGLTVWQRSSTERMDDVTAVLLAEVLDGRRVAIQEYGMENPELTALLGEAGADVVEVTVYRWRLPEDSSAAERLVEAACQGRVDAVTFTSAPAVHNLFAIAGRLGVASDLRDAFNRDVTAACVGPVCAGGARKEGIEEPLVPAVGRLGLLVRALSEHFGSRRRTLSLAGTELVVQGSAFHVGESSGTLTSRERAVFELLAAVPGAVVPRETLLAEVWGSAEADPHVIEVTIGRLRRRLGPWGAAIEAVSGRGYRLDPEVGAA
ncbi:MAG: uroporphyrinogen-III synthase [Acidimicrobiales bacterium]